MSVAERIADFWNGVLDRARDSAAEDVTPGKKGDFEEFRAHQHCLVVTYRRSGEAVPTPVWFGIAEGKLYFRSEERVGKIKRIRGNDRVLVSPCSSRGKPLGSGVEARARILPPQEEAGAEAAIQANFGLGRRMYEAVSMSLAPKAVYVEVVPV